MKQAATILAALALMVLVDVASAGLLHRRKHHQNYAPVGYAPNYGYAAPTYYDAPEYGIAHEITHPHASYPVAHHQTPVVHNAGGNSAASASAAAGSASASASTAGNGGGHNVEYTTPVRQHGLSSRLMHGRRRHEPYYNSAPYGGYAPVY